MSIKQAFKLAIDSIFGNKMRSFLTMLGMIIGVASVIALVSLMQGMTEFMEDSFSEMGTNQINVMVQNTNTRKTDVNGVYDLVSSHKDLFKSVSPSVNVQGTVKKGPDMLSTTSIKGVGEDFAYASELKIREGRFLQYSDVLSRNNNCVIGTYLVEKLFNGNDAIGQTIKINNESYTIVGILDKKADSTKGSADDCIYLTYTNANKLMKSKDVSTYVFSTIDAEQSASAKKVIEDYLFKIFKDEKFYTIISMAEMLDMMKSMTGTMSNVLVGVAGISLLVAGIGIMNIMLVSVSERTREIGIRKSLGAKRHDIMSQFVIEAAVTSSLGGIIGIIIGGLATSLLGNLVGLNASPSVSAIAISFGVSAGIGICFGYMPASRAAKLNPIDALRSE